MSEITTNEAFKDFASSDAGSAFNYDLWTPNTVARFTNVPWNNDYRDVVRFSDDAGLRKYLDSQEGHQITHMTTAKVNMPIRVDLSFNAASQYNYVYVTNGNTVHWADERYYYYFITDVQYIAPHTTQLMLQLDVFQTFGYGISFGRSYVERGHIGVVFGTDSTDFNERPNDKYSISSRDVLTIPEGFDLGSDMQVKETAVETIMTFNQTGTNDQKPAVVVMSTVALNKPWGSVDDPKLNSATGSSFGGMPNGASLYYFYTTTDFITFMEFISGYPWVSQGIISIQVVPQNTINYNSSVEVMYGGVYFRVLNGLSPNHEQQYVFWERMKSLSNDNAERMAKLYPYRYRNLYKFLYSPYTMYEVTTNTGQPLALKPEMWDGEMVGIYHLTPPNPRIGFYPFRYNAARDSLGDSKSYGDGNKVFKADGGEHWDYAIYVGNMPTFSITNNGYISFLASNSNTIPYQYSSADWSQQRALAGNDVGYNQASAAMNASNQLTGIGVNAANLQTNIANTTQGAKVVTNGVAGILGGAVTGGLYGAAAGVGSAAMGGINAAIDINARNQSTNVSNNAAISSNNVSVGNMGYNRDTNKAYADFAARGDYSNQIAGLNAKVQDAKMIQPTTSGQLGGDAFMLTTATGLSLTVKAKIPSPSAVRAIGEYWLRYGYAVNAFFTIPDSLQVMSKFTFWKCKEVYITRGNMPETFKQTIRGIFESGVTVWSNPKEMGKIDPTLNEPIPNMSDGLR